QNAFVHAVREDPKRRGLLFAATEEGVFVSFNDGAHWQSLQRNLPKTSMHDIVVHDNDLIVATHGRAFWVLDDIAPLRQHAAENPNQEAVLFKPSPAYRFFGGGGIPGLPGRSTVGQNPPSGAIIYYQLKTALKTAKAEERGETGSTSAAKTEPQSPEFKTEKPARVPGQPSVETPEARTGGEISLDILDSAGKVVRHYPSRAESEGQQPGEDEGFRGRGRGARLSGDAGLNRFVWDLR